VNKVSSLMLVPSINKVIEHIIDITSGSYSRELITDVSRDVVSDMREKINQNLISFNNKNEAEIWIKELVLNKINDLYSTKLRKVINATGVVLHTNLGRSVYSQRSVDRIKEVASNYSNLEYDLLEGNRGSRDSHLEDLICQITSAEGALVVNNNAAAVFLVLREFAKEREVVVSRGEIIEIGGSFRISEIIRESDARLIEVGTTNKTRYSDYEKAINNNTALLLKMHKSNFYTIGFTESVDRKQLVHLGRVTGIPVFEDLGSGILMDFDNNIKKIEPSVKSVLNEGVDLVSISGDKLLGGPQAGIIVGKRQLIKRLKKNQLVRALRVDKVTIAALEATFQHYLDPEDAKNNIPTLRVISKSIDVIRIMAEKVIELIEIGDNDLITMEQVNSLIGGGSLPGLELPSLAIVIKSSKYSVNQIEERLRRSSPPVIARIKDNSIVLDLRTVKDDELFLLAKNISDSVK
jgi:L-seryl-tRNA(Ser) seleniumtransferase